MGSPALGRAIVVPVANPASVRPLLWIAATLLEPDGEVVLVTVLAQGAPSRERERARETIEQVEHEARELGVPARGQVLDAVRPSDGVLAAVAEHDASLVLMGWRGRSSTTDVFGRLIDSVVGRSSVPLAVVRLGTEEVDRVLLPVSADHLLPAGRSGLGLAAELATRIARVTTRPTTIVRTGPGDEPLPADLVALGDRVHHDPRRTDQAVAAFARASDLVVAAVAPTVSGLRAATTHLAWAAPDATLLVAVDVGPRRADESLVDAVDEAGAPAPLQRTDGTAPVRIVVTARLPEAGTIAPDELERILARAGATQRSMTWWPADDPRPHVRTTVTVEAAGVTAAMSTLMSTVHEADDFRGAEITYDVETDTAPDR